MATRLPEASVSDQIREFMRKLGWRDFRQQSGIFKKNYGGTARFIRIGEDGLPDFRFERYLPAPGFALTCYVEVKSKTGKLRPQQIDWIRAAQRDGAVCLVANSIEQFTEQYYKVFGWVHDAVGFGAVMDAMRVFGQELSGAEAVRMRTAAAPRRTTERQYSLLCDQEPANAWTE